MGRTLLLLGIIFVGFAGWSVGGKLSPDALSMAIGLLFGVVASIPAALLVLAAGRRRSAPDAAPSRNPQPATPPQAPVIVLAAPSVPGYGLPQSGQQSHLAHPALPASHQIVDAHPQRQFRVIGEEDEFVDAF